MTTTSFEKEISALIIDTLMLTEVSLDTIQADASLVDSYGLDSIDFLELAMVLTKTYGVEFADGDKANAQHFASVRSLASHVQAQRGEVAAPATASNENAVSSDEDRVFLEIKAGLRELCEVSVDTLSRDTRLVDDLGLDSLDALDLVGRLQDTLGARIPDDRLTKLKTVGDVVDVTVELFREQHVA